MVNMPTDVYSNVADAQADISSTAVFDIPREFNTESSTGYLIAKITFQKKSGTWNNLGWTDLRGSSARSAAGAGSTPPPGSIVNFPDDLFTIYDTLDTTKIINFTLDGFSTLETHNYTPPRGDGTFALLEGITGGQTLYGGNAASDTLTIEGTSNATKGYTLINPSGGNVGIGTIAPDYNFNVNASSNPNIGLSVPNVLNNVQSIYFNTGNGVSTSSTLNALIRAGVTQTSPVKGKLQFFVNSGVLSEKMTIDDTGYVGIGITIPLTPLHVTGTISGSALDISGTISASNIGTDTDNSVVILNASGLFKTDEIDSRVWGSTLVDGTSTAGHVAYWSDTNTLTGENALSVTRGGTGLDTIGINYILTGNGTSAMSAESGLRYFSSTLDVVGTVSASTALHTAGFISAPNLSAGVDNSVLILDADGIIKTDEIDSRVWGSTLVDGAGAANQISYWSDTNTQTGTSTFVYSAENRVGLGVASPLSKLHIKGHVSESNSGSLFRVEGSSGSLFEVVDSLVGSLMSVNDISGLPILEVFDTDKVVMGSFNQNTLVVTGSKVGIGTDIPTNKLTVNASTSEQNAFVDISAHDGPNPGLGIRTAGINFGSQFSSGTGLANSGILNIPEANADGNLLFYTRDYSGATEGAEGSEKMRIAPSGNVGIGTITPSQKLDVSGSIKISEDTAQLLLPFSNVASTPTLAFGDGDTGFYETSDDTLSVAVGGGERFRFTTVIFGASNPARSALLNETPSSTNPNIVPAQTDSNTGLG